MRCQNRRQEWDRYCTLPNPHPSQTLCLSLLHPGQTSCLLLLLARPSQTLCLPPHPIHPWLGPQADRFYVRWALICPLKSSAYLQSRPAHLGTVFQPCPTEQLQSQTLPREALSPFGNGDVGVRSQAWGGVYDAGAGVGDPEPSYKLRNWDTGHRKDGWG